MPVSETSWDADLLRNPHAVADKRRRVQEMFSAIAPTYDLNNRLHSLWMDQHWRRRAVSLAMLRPGDVVVDVACGTGDLALKFARALSRLSPPSPAHLLACSPALGASGPVPPRISSVFAIDFTYPMLPLARAKSTPASAPIWINGDALCLPLPDSSADVVSIAFGIRNVSDPAAALAQFHRILRPGGRLIILEFSLPRFAPLRALYNFYFRRILPRTATFISRDKTGAYQYLPQSVNTFIGRQEMLQAMTRAGFTDARAFPMTCGICVAYRGIKP